MIKLVSFLQGILGKTVLYVTSAYKRPEPDAMKPLPACSA